MKPGQEIIHGRCNTSLNPSISRVCFTEIRLSQAEDHAKKYGHLGIGFHRDFVLERMGNPVLYVQNGDKGALIQNLRTINDFLKEKDKKMYEYLLFVLGYLKSMSKPKEQDLQFYEEMEWRIVHNIHLDKNHIKVEDASGYIYRLTLEPKDIKIIVFPDHETKEMAVKDSDISGFFKQGFPMMTPLSDCNSF
jgi:hypothetical protein